MKRLLLVCSFVFCLPLWADSISLTYDFDSRWVNGEWQGDWWEEPGRPMVPVVWAKILLPHGKDVEAVRFDLTAGYFDAPRNDIRLAPIPYPMCEGDAKIEVERPLEVGEVFPSEIVGKKVQIVKHGFRIVYLPLFPMLLETRGTLRISGGELHLSLQEAKDRSTTFRGLASDRQEVESLIENRAELATYPILKNREDAKFLLIGPSSYLDHDSTHFFLSNKMIRGITSKKISIEEITAQGTGADLQAKIRNTILAHYKNSGTQFALIIGNGYSIAPTKKLSVSNETIPSDLYFACLDGPGTSSNMDLACEVAVGRAPVSSVSEWQIFVSKSLKMHFVQKDDPRVWNELNFGEKMDSSTLADKLVEQLLNGGKAGNIVTKGYTSSVKPKKLYETFSMTYTAQQVVDALNAGEFYTVNHMGHASQTYCMRFKNTYIPQIKNELPFFGITQGCHPGDIRGQNWASQLVLSPVGGAGAMIANSSYGWYMPNSSDGPSNRHHLLFYDAVFNEGIKNLGRANNRAKERLIPQVQSSSTMKKIVFETNLLGDPEIELKF